MRAGPDGGGQDLGYVWWPRRVGAIYCCPEEGGGRQTPDTCVDINPRYLEALVERAAALTLTVEPITADLGSFEPAGRFNLIHAALVLEYVPRRPVLHRLAAALSPGGVLSVVLQRPSSTTPAVTPSEFTSLLSLESIFRFVECESLITEAAAAKLRVILRRTEPLPSEKVFEVLRFTPAQG
jgi:SAM-dependent methyltransferase